jgi:hypothetical protein
MNRPWLGLSDNTFQYTGRENDGNGLYYRYDYGAYRQRVALKIARMRKATTESVATTASIRHGECLGTRPDQLSGETATSNAVKTTRHPLRRLVEPSAGGCAAGLIRVSSSLKKRAGGYVGEHLFS